MINKYHTIGVIGAGTMGIGIAEVAASQNQQVYLYDLNTEFAHGAKASMSKRLQSRVQRGKIKAEFRQQIIDNITIVEDLNQFSKCQLVLEAIIEDLEIKQKLFKQLESICKKDTLFASNTSSISITAIASALDQPENMIGLHFFNPAPVMKLVEVISGLRSSQEKLNDGMALCKLWNKIPALAKSTPGFIVNRVARPFYGEALKMRQEQVAPPKTIDTLMQSAGFRMGPFTLMDLIGMDINLSVSQTVFASMYNDPRYRPSLIQEEMVAANLLGKKTGRGFYDYTNESEDVKIEIEPTYPLSSKVSLSEETDVFNQLFALIKQDNIKVIEYHDGLNEIIIDNCLIKMSNGLTCSQRISGSDHQYMAQVDLSLNYETCSIINLSFDKNCPDSTKQQVVALFQSIGKKVIVTDDLPALIVMRIVSLLINEAADAIENGVCNEVDVDLAMQYGVNYPIGLIQWAKNLGIKNVIEVLDNMHQWFGDDRYRVSPWLRKNI